MIFFLLSIVSVTALALNGVTFLWFMRNKDNNQLHKIVNLQLKYPIERALYVDQDIECPTGTSEERVVYRYESRNGMCADIDIYLQKNGYAQKICISHIEGYSFANKAPLESQCDDDEKYCSWQTDQSDGGFDIDNGYCIPISKECYKTGFELGKYNSKQEKQLPLVDFEVSNTKSSYYNIVDLQEIKEFDLLKMNNLIYPSEYDSYESYTYTFQAMNMPRVEAKCRSSLKDTLGRYLGIKGAYNLSLAILIFSSISGSLCFYFGVIDIYHFYLFCTKNIPYCEAKRISSKNKRFKNIMLFLKPFSTFIQEILLIVLIKKYLIIQQEMDRMIYHRCLDDDVIDVIYHSRHKIYIDDSLMYIPFALSSATFIFDQNVYVMIKTITLIILCRKKISCQRPIQQIGVEDNNQNNIQVSNQNQNNRGDISFAPSLQNNNDVINNSGNKKPRNQNNDVIQMQFAADRNRNALDQLVKKKGRLQLRGSQLSQEMVSNDQYKLEKLRKKQEEIKEQLEKMRQEEQIILAQQNGFNLGIRFPEQNFKLLSQSKIPRLPEAPKPPEESDKQSESHFRFDF